MHHITWKAKSCDNKAYEEGFNITTSTTKKKKGKGLSIIQFFFNTILLVPKKKHKFLWTQWKQMNICLRFLWIVLIFCSVFLHDIIYMLYKIYSITFIALCVIYLCVCIYTYMNVMGLPYYIYISSVS